MQRRVAQQNLHAAQRAALHSAASCALGSLQDTAYGFSVLFDPLSILSAAGRALHGPTSGLGVLHCSTLERARVAHLLGLFPVDFERVVGTIAGTHQTVDSRHATEQKLSVGRENPSAGLLAPILQLHGCQMRKRAHDAQQYKNSD